MTRGNSLFFITVVAYAGTTQCGSDRSHPRWRRFTLRLNQRFPHSLFLLMDIGADILQPRGRLYRQHDLSIII